MSENDHFYQNHPYPGFPHGGPGFGMNSGNFPPYMNYPPPMLPYPKPPIKRMIERFLYESNTDKYILKMVLYRLMVFIDSHY